MTDEEVLRAMNNGDGVPFADAARWLQHRDDLSIRRKVWDPWLLAGKPATHELESRGADVYLVRNHKTFTFTELAAEERLNNDWLLIVKHTFHIYTTPYFKED